MGKSLTRKILEDHLLRGNLQPDEENAIRIDHALLQDATGTMVALQFEQIGLPRIKPELAVVYVDHNMLQLDYRNPEDHRFLQTWAAKRGLHFSRPGNGICHQVNTERFARPGKTLLGADSHTPTAGAVGCLAIGAGGLEVAVALAGHPFELSTPRIVKVRLEGRLSPWVEGKDVILEMLRRIGVKGGLGNIYEFGGPGAAALPVTARATICNMIAELGATSGIFPSDENTRHFLRQQQREEQWVELKADADAEYDEEIVIELDKIVPLIAQPHNPDNVVPVEEIAGTRVAQVCVGSCVNSWYPDLALVAEILSRGEGVHPEITMTVSPGSRQILDTITRTGVLEKLTSAGARILEPACGPCVGMGQAPPEGIASVRTFNRNFRGRSGTLADQVFLCSPPTAAAIALRGEITDPRQLGDYPKIEDAAPVINDRMILPPLPQAEAERAEIIYGRNILPPPAQSPLPESLEGKVLIRLGDNISTGSMTPDGALVMADRSNVPALAQYCFAKEDPDFISRAQSEQGGFIVGGENYGQGSSREHAALAPKQLGVTAVFAKGFARIHRRNLIAQGLLPLPIPEEVYRLANIGASWKLPAVREELAAGESHITLRINGKKFRLSHGLNKREREMLLAGGALAWIREREERRAQS
ncbi:MAG: aconitate hydratase [Armatimonadetes bacterium]|nr:aconitate hydratase [Armatimonadota bacterium]NIM24543.1 aconitate hydratase [Armatimonadota bacterium]NIM68417.1 aconitate hydratase [Armatimonadota bacterium]NIM76803.1 aconitate hydratase [Armatimonadota bacterium]NIN06616.1 aconitate hydratase [Armatimonadota bacterium]